jgi:hypothetical protein
MTIKDLFDTLDFSSYDKIVVHWPTSSNSDGEFNEVSFDFAEPLIELFGSLDIMTMDKTSEYDGGDASLFINTLSGQIVIHIYLRREDVVRDNT